MKYAIRFYRGCRTLPKADEIIIQYLEKNPNLLEFVKKEEYLSKRIVIDVSNWREGDLDENLEIFKAAHKINPNIAVRISKSLPLGLAEDLSDEGIPFFFSDGINSLDDLIWQIEKGVSDVYIVNEFGFMLQKISKLCHEHNVNVRVYPNVAQSAQVNYTPALKKFFIRPADLEFYENYIDIIEFWGSIDKQAVLYDIYNDERWLGYLNDVILGFSEEELIDDKTIVPYFGEARAGCEKRCAFGRCDICSVIKELAFTLEEKDLGLVKKKPRRVQYEENVEINEDFIEKEN